MSTDVILEDLNPPQREAVITTEGPVLILAGAGSGKTRVLTRRMAYLLATRRAWRSQMLAVTFTNKAAREMKERVEHLCHPGRFPDLGTFHAVCARWLRREGEAVGLDPRFVIYDTAEQLLVMKQVIREDLKLDEKKFRPRSFLTTVSSWKNRLVGVEEAYRDAEGPYERSQAEAYELYQRRLAENRAVDFDDILFQAVELFRRSPELLAAYQERLRYILIDEYQDVNPVQYELVRLLAGERANLCCVGDDDQSIYAFRGADVSILLRFEHDFPEARVIKLEQNYRSTHFILDASNAVVAHNEGRKPKALWTDREGGEKLACYLAADGRDEARYVARKIQELRVAGGSTPGDFVVLYRINAQSRLLEEAMIQAGMPYRLVGGLRFFDRKEVKDILSYLRLLQNPADSMALLRILNVPARGVGATSLGRIVESARQRGLSLYETLQDLKEVKLPARARQELERLAGWMDALRERLPGLGVGALLEEVLEQSGYRKALQQETTVEAQARLENLAELSNVAAEFDRNAEERTLEAFLSELSLLSDQDTYDEQEGSVTLMTVHAAKGLEFPVVFLVGLEEELFPHARARDNLAELEEERRLCYVGMTRAMDRLFLTSAQARDVQGECMLRRASRFLKEIPKETLQREGPSWEGAPARPRRSSPDSSEAPIGSDRWRGWGKNRRSPGVATYRGGEAMARVGERAAPPAVAACFPEGERVRHKIFGLGTVTRAERDLISVRFDERGDKVLKADFLTQAGKVAVGDRVEHARYGSGVVKAAQNGNVTVVFPSLTVSMSVEEALHRR